MKKYMPIILSIIALVVLFSLLIYIKSDRIKPDTNNNTFGNFDKQRSCVQLPKFLEKQKIANPIMIDLTQQRFTGIGFLHGKGLKQTLHSRAWERYEHFSTYALDKVGNLYLAPMPFISIKPTTFNLQKNIYKMDSETSKLSIFMHFDDVHPSISNPYGIISIVYDCDDDTLWVSAIDETDYSSENGVIYHIDIKTKSVLQRIEGFDAFTIKLLRTDKDKYLLAGSARDNGLYAFTFNQGVLLPKPKKLLELAQPEEHIRKIKILDKNKLELQIVSFAYTMVTETSDKYRVLYQAEKKNLSSEWKLTKMDTQH